MAPLPHATSTTRAPAATPGEPSEPQRQPLAARVQLVVEQPARGVALVQAGAAALGVGLEVVEGDAGDHALALAARSARTCAR